jgi:hydroxymethylpyrimidine/phosphomethylpyrimidine kinase
MSRPRLLIVAGHDPSGAGIDADLASVADLEVEPVPIVTARTDQDEHGLRSIGARAPAAWLAEARAASRGGVGALKLGLLPGVEHVRAAAELVRELRARDERMPIVLDPVLAASSGGRFLEEEAVEALRAELIALGLIVTPNVPEAAELTMLPAGPLRDSLLARLEAARLLVGLGAAAVVLKGGHGSEEPVHDLVIEADGDFRWIDHPRVTGGKVRGSGCRFATRLAARLALGGRLVESAAEAGTHVAERIRAAGKRG